jgi:protein-tyrosine phosphatase
MIGAKMPPIESVLPLIADGDLPIGLLLTCPLPGVVPEGLRVHGQITADPTQAMRHATGQTDSSDNGWTFWKLNDPVRGFIKPLEHVRVAWLTRQLSKTVRTSDGHPLRINRLDIPGLPGSFGLTFCPGKKSDSIYGGDWDRDLDKDLAALRDWGASAVLTVLEDHEFALLGVPDFPAAMKAQPFQWHYLNIRDSDVPDDRFESAWPGVREQLAAVLENGGSVVVHCRGGLGRTGLVVARFLVEEGMDPESAITLVRSVRPGAIETWEQENHVRSLVSAPTTKKS